MKIHADSNINNEFQEYYLNSSLLFMKRGFAVTILLFTGIVLMTRAFFPDSTSIEYMVRFGAILPIMLVPLLSITYKPARKNLQHILATCALCSPIPVFIVGATSDINEAGYQFYYTWVMLVLIGNFTFYRIRLVYIFMSGTLIIIGYAVATVINQQFRADPLEYINKLFFVMAASSVGYFVTISSYRLIYNNFLHKLELNDYNEKLQSRIIENSITESALQESRMHYLTVIDSIPDMLYVVDKNLCFEMINKAGKEIHRRFGLEKDIVGRKVTDVYDFSSTERIAEIEEVLLTGKEIIKDYEQVVRGNVIHAEISTIPIFSGEKVTKAMVIIRDQSKRFEIEELKRKNLIQKELLLREIHHRVKNNLAIVISLLDMQIRKNPNPAFIKMARDMESRIRSMALIHEQLYKSEELDRVPIDRYLMTLASNTIRSSTYGNIQLSGQLIPVDVTIEVALPLGLIANEILTNACKYAFPGKTNGKINIDLVKEDCEDEMYRLTISDNGVGFPAGYSLEEKSSLGVLIIQLLVEQIEARLEIINQNGTSFSILFSRFGSNNK